MDKYSPNNIYLYIYMYIIIYIYIYINFQIAIQITGKTNDQIARKCTSKSKN